MTARKWEKEYESWVGTAAELAAVAQEVIDAIGMKDPEVHPNERLIRHYAQMGVLDRAERKGREAFFGFRQLAQYLVARNLAMDGWPLAKIADFTSNSKLRGLLDLIPKPVQQENAVAGKTFEQVVQDAKQHTRKRQELNSSLHNLCNVSGKVQKKQLMEVIFSPWCKVHIDQNDLHEISSEEAELIGKALTRLLKGEL